MRKIDLIKAIDKYDDYDEVVISDCGEVCEIEDILYDEYNGIILCI